MRPTQATTVPFTPRSFDPGAPTPLYRQLYNAVRAAILDGQLPAGARLPATRVLAVDLGLSRTTVLTAMAQLLAEGYVEGKRGSGTCVARILPDAALHIGRAPAGVGPSSSATGRTLSRRGQLLATASLGPSRDAGMARAFRPGVPALDLFPWKTWLAIEGRLLRRLSGALRLYDNPAGYRPLRQAVADYLGAARAVRCEADQVIVVAGSQQALDLVARVLLDPGDAVWVEEPGYAGAKGALAAAGARVVPAPVDAEGLDVAAARQRCAAARLAYVTPSHQYPLGMTMSLSRRLALLRWASDAGAWVVEDDYDSEYRYTGRPLAALQGLDTEGRVIYTGTFSKVLFPALRLGYLVVPTDLADAFARAKALTDRGSPVLGQAMLADFLAEGHFGRHIRRMRARCTVNGRRRWCGRLGRAWRGRSTCRPRSAECTSSAGSPPRRMIVRCRRRRRGTASRLLRSRRSGSTRAPRPGWCSAMPRSTSSRSGWGSTAWPGPWKPCATEQGRGSEPRALRRRWNQRNREGRWEDGKTRQQGRQAARARHARPRRGCA